MPAPNALPDLLSDRPGDVNVVLFSQPDCTFCEEVRSHYLKPLAAQARRGIVVAEVSLVGTTPVRDWSDARPTQARFARDHGAKFAPTVMFFGPHGETLAPPIVGLSRDYFGAYLDERIDTALKAVR